MAELRPVAGPRSPFAGHGGKVAAVIAVAIVVAVLKPWGERTASAPRISRASPTPELTPEPSAAAPEMIDFLAFWPKEPRPRWELWPAGYLVSFGFAMRLEDVPAATGGPGPSGEPVASGARGPSAAPTASGTPPGSPDPSASPGLYIWPGTGDSPPAWPREISIPAGSHLYVIGLNRPLGIDVKVLRLVRFEADGSSRAENLILAPTPWPDHFTIIGMATADAPGTLGAWPPGRYRLDVLIEPDHVERSVDIAIDGETATPASPSAGPGTLGLSSAAPGGGR